MREPGRIPGSFAISWEQRKLGELAEIVGGGTPSTSVESYWDGDIDWYAPAEIGEQIYLKSSQRKITEEGLNKSSAKVLPVGTVLFTSRAGIGKTAILLKEGCTNQGFQSIVPNKNKLDSYFIFTRSEELKRYGETVGAGSTFVEVSGKQMANMELMMPTTMDEQQKIGEYFSNLDNLITLHQRNLCILYILERLLYENIKQFEVTVSWEQRKFSELCDMVTVGIANSATHAYSDSGIVMFRNQNIKPNFLDDNDIIHIKPEFESRYKNKRLKKNDLLVARTGYPGTACVVPEKYENSQTFTTLIARLKNSVNPYFLCQYLNSDIGVKYFESTQIGGGQKNSGAGILNEMPVMLPSGIEEESKIAEYFTNFDHLITLHQRKP